MEMNICNGCKRHCDLNEPHCSRGEEYRRTGKMPQKQEKGHRHELHRADSSAADMNDRILTNLRELGHIMRMLYEGKASQKRILMILNESETITQRDLTKRLGIQPGSASEILAKLESAGWIIRIQNETDHRTTDLSLTDSGKELAAEALAQRRRRHEEMFSCLCEEEKQELLSLLEKVCADWKSRYAEHGNAHRQHRHDCPEAHVHYGGHRGHGGFHEQREG